MCLRVLCLSFVLVSPALAENWPQWRGPTGQGLSGEKELPLEWSPTKNVRWKIALPEAGNSSPIVWQDKVFLTCPDKSGVERILFCFKRQDGRELWKRSVSWPEKEVTHATNPQCSSSPVTDGERVIVWHGSPGLYCYDLAGKELWHKDLGKFEHIWGTGSSPVIHGDLVILNAGPGIPAFVAAFDKRSGEEKWRTTFAEMTSTKTDEFRGSWSTPTIVGQGPAAILLLSLPSRLWAVRPTTGEEVWSAKGLSHLAYTSPLVENEVVVAMCGYHGPALAVKLGGSGDVTESHRLWLHDKQNPQRIGSGVAVGGYVYILNENSTCWCLDARTGEKQWEQRIGSGNSWGSMCHAAGKLYVLNMQGNTLVLEANPQECKVLAENKLNEGSRSSLALSDGQIFVRTFKNLYCVEGK